MSAWLSPSTRQEGQGEGAVGGVNAGEAGLSSVDLLGENWL